MTEYVTAFEKPDFEGPGFKDVLELLAIDPDSAGDLLAKVAKARIIELTGNPLKREIQEDLLAHPTWVVQQSVAFSYSQSPIQDIAVWIDRCVSRVATTIREEADSKVVTMGALRVKLYALGSGFFNVVIRQKFTVGRDVDPSTRINDTPKDPTSN